MCELLMSSICVASLQNSSLVGNFWFAFYISYRTHQYKHLEGKKYAPSCLIYQDMIY